MEIHRSHPPHDDPPHARRQWRRFAAEFMMIAIAVFVGSMGEYLLEHRIMVERRDEGLRLILRNLETDRENLAAVIASSEEGLAFLQRTRRNAFEFRTGRIDQREYFKRVADDVPNAYNYRTLFIDRSGFNLISAVGVASIIETQELKAALSFYYEVMGHRINDNNMLVDDEAGRYFRESYLLPRGTGLRRDSGEDSDIAFFLTLPAVTGPLLSDRFIVETDYLTIRVVDYGALLLNLRERNQQLDALIRQSLE